MPTYSPADFEGAPFAFGQRVRIHLYTHQGVLLGTITGELAGREPKVNVARDPEAPPQYKTLYWVKNIEGYQRPHEDTAMAAAGQAEDITEGWFAEQDLQPLPEEVTRETIPTLLPRN